VTTTTIIIIANITRQIGDQVPSQLSELDSALWKRITHIVLTETRPFSYVDFVPSFEVDGQHHTITHKTFRNKISVMLKTEKIEVAYYSPQAFYSIKGIKFGKLVSVDHIGVVLPLPLRHIKNDPIYRSVKVLPFGQKGLHNLRLRFEVRGVWSVLSSNTDYIPNHKSKDIRLERIVKNELGINITIHRTDTISMVVDCSYSPIGLDATGVDRLSTALQTVKETLCKTVKDHNLFIPDHVDWIVTMWHFGADALTNFAGEKYHRRWEIAEKILFTIYAKEWQHDKRRIRWDCQEYPNRPIALALDEKLNANKSN